jgi:hypothetical protein
LIIVAESSALYTAFDADQPEHRDTLDIVDREVLAISPLVVTELDDLVHLVLGFGRPVQAGRPSPRSRPDSPLSASCPPITDNRCARPGSEIGDEQLQAVAFSGSRREGARPPL